jgi:anaerobic C4-dicarboxylate transporter
MNSLAEPAFGARLGNNPRPASAPHTIPVVALGMGLSAFLAISYVICIVGYLLLPTLPVAHAALGIFLPGFTLLTWPSFFLGLVESAAWGWYVAVLFAPLYNFFARRFPQ